MYLLSYIANYVAECMIAYCVRQQCVISACCLLTLVPHAEVISQNGSTTQNQQDVNSSFMVDVKETQIDLTQERAVKTPVYVVSYMIIIDRITVMLLLISSHLQQIDVLFSQRLDPAGQEFSVTSTIQHLATVKNSFMVVVEAITTGFRQLLNVLHTVPIPVSELRKCHFYVLVEALP